MPTPMTHMAAAFAGRPIAQRPARTAPAVKPATVKVRVSATIDNEYATRSVFGPGQDDWPEVPGGAGVHEVPRATAEAMLKDAEFNSDRKAFDIGEYGMPLPVYNAYRALAKQLRQVLS